MNNIKSQKIYIRHLQLDSDWKNTGPLKDITGSSPAHSVAMVKTDVFQKN